MKRAVARAMARRAPRVGLSKLALVVGWLLSSPAIYANPTGGVVVGGTASINNSAPGTTNIFQSSQRGIIDWQSFSIGAGETVNFFQPAARSVTLNRVLGNDPSQIFGRMNANGTVMLVNPNGIVFGPTARVDVGGLVATTANIRNEDFMAGRHEFGLPSSRPGAGVENHGHISIRDSGLAALVAPRVRNSGVIEARLGRVVLGATTQFSLDFHGDGLLSFGAGSAITQAPGGEAGALVVNSGEIRAEGGTVLLTAHAVKGVVDQVINTSGIIAATSVSGEGGRIVLSGGNAGTVAVSGRVDVSSAAGQGGKVVATGDHIAVAGTARVEASGHTGGGEIALGSTGLTDPSHPFANKSNTVDVAAGAQLRADALGQGNGGDITMWSNDRTVFAGSLSARGGAQGGNGGFAEVSSHKDIGLTGQVDLRAPQGQSGLLLIDPTDLRITDAASGGSQDGNAGGDATVAAGDANQGSGATLNTVSRGLLESLSGNANILLQATGQITVDAMAGGRIDLGTTGGHGFTLQSTQTGGIRFTDANTEIRTQGGSITLDAQGIGSSLSNIGRLTTNGGAVTLTASGDISLAGNINAGAGAVSAQSTVGSISNASGASPVLTGGSVTLSTSGGALGASGSTIGTLTSQLNLEAGGSMHVANTGTLTALSITARDVAPGIHSYAVSATGLSFDVTDGSGLTVTQLSSATPLNLTLTSDRNIELGTVNVGSGTLAVSATQGNLTGMNSNALTAGSVTLTARGSTGINAAIGTSGQSLNTSTASLAATSGTGGVYVANTGSLALNTLNTSGSSSVSSSGSLTVGNVSAGTATLALGSTSGSVLDDGNSATRINAGTLNVTAGGAIGASGNRLATNASTISANAGVGGVYASTTATSSVLSSVVSGNGAIDITTGGSTTMTSLTSSTSSSANSITVAATGTGSFSVGTIDAGSAGNVSLTTSSGSIFGNTGNIIGDTVTLNAATSGSVAVRTAASHLDVQAGSSSITITQTGNVTLDRLSTPSTLVSVTNSSGDITVGNVSTSTSGQVSLTASAGNIFDDGNTSTRISTGTAVLSASQSIGSGSHAVQTRATGLSATSTGNLYVTNTDATLTSLSITNRHSAPGAAAVLQVTSPYLTFNVNDTGTAYELNQIVGVPLNALSFNGDTSIALGQIQAAGSVSITSTAGSLSDDGNRNTRVTSGSTLTLSAATGGLGSAANPLGVNASALTATTRGDLYASSLTDLSTLTITSTHPDTTTSYGMGITAPSLRLSVTDSAAGHNIATLTDSSSLTVNFTSDRDITLGNVNLTNTGTARFTSTGGSIVDDGNKATTVLANSTTLSGAAVGASGSDYLDVVTGTLAATASVGGVYVNLPMPTGSTNTTSTVTLGTITAAGPVAITAQEGDLSLGGFMTATNQAVNLTATQGSILSPYGYGLNVGTGTLTLSAAQAIGANGAAIPVMGSGSTLNATAGTGVFMSSSGATTLNNLSATTGITFTQSSGATTVGTVNAGSGSVSLTNGAASIADDGNTGTAITGSQVTLSAAVGSVGTSGAVMNLSAPSVSITANGNVYADDSQTLTTLNLTRGASSSGTMAINAGGGQTFAITEDDSAHTLSNVTSSTALNFGFSGPREVRVGAVNVGAGGSATLAATGSTASVVNDAGGAAITAGTVSLTAGTEGSIGALGDAISLVGTNELTLSAGRNFYAGSDAALSSLNLTSTNSTTAAGTASVFGITGLGQTFAITDSGTTQSLDFSGTALDSFGYTTRKNIQAGDITATGDVTISTAGGGANSNISSDSGSGRIAGNRVLLTATSSTAGGGSIGTSGTALRVNTPTLVLNGSANIYVDDSQNLTSLDMTVTHGTNTTFGYGVTAGNVSSFAITDGSTQSLGLAVSGAMNFAYSVDRALSLGTIDVGTSSTGAMSLTSRSAPTGTNAQINRASGSLTAGSVTLSATGTNGGVGAGATLSTNTQNLSIASGGNVSVSNATTLTSLSLDARHRTSGSSTHSYAISSTGLTFSISDTLGSNAFQLTNISQSGLNLSVKADRVITASSVNTGAGGDVTLESSSYVQGGSGANAGSPSITTGDLTLRGGSAFGYQGSTPLYTAASTLNSNLSNTLYLSNAGALTLGTNTVASSADVASSDNSLLQGSGGLFTTPTLRLSANQSIGSTGTVLTDARRLTLVSRNNVDVSNASDLYALTLTSTHGTPGVQNTISVAAPRLNLSLTDSVGGNQYHLASMVDNSGIDFTLSTDVALNLGTVDAKAGRSITLSSTGTGTSITNNGSAQLTGNSVTLSAAGSVGVAGDSGTRMQTTALGVSVTTGANAYLDNAQDLSSLSLTSTQVAGGAAPVYQFTAPALSFDVTDDGSTHVNNVSDSTGINFTLSTQRNQAIGVINVGPSGTVTLAGAGDILGDADRSRRITAASGTFTASSGGALGSVGNPLQLTVPLVAFNPTGALNVESDTHIDRLSISVTHPTVTYGGAYSIVSTPISGAAYQLFSATDGILGTALTNLTDTEGLAFSFTSDRAMQVGRLNLGTTGTVTLTGTGSGGILGDGDPDTQVRAASLSMTSLGGAVGANGSGNGIDATVNTVSATALSGGVNLALHGRTQIGSISGTSGVNVNNDVGDITLGSINAGGSTVTIDNQGGSILSGSISNATTVGLTAQGSIGNTSAITTSANGGGTTNLTASAAAANGAAGSVAISESYNLLASSVTAPGAVTLSSGYGLLAGTVTSGGAVSLSSSQGSINGSNSSNAITGTSVSLSARYGTGNSIGSSGTRINVNTPVLSLNTPGSVYVTDSVDLSTLSIDRTNYSADGSSGTLSVIGSGLTFSATDSGNTTTLTSLSDGTGLDFTYLGVGSLSIGSLNVGSGTMLLQAYLSSGDGNITAINGSSLITAGNLTLQAYGSGSTIGSSGTRLGTAVGSLTASSGTGGLHLNQAGSLNLSSLSTTGNLAVTASTGDLTLGTLSYGSSSTLNLAATTGSILAGTSTLTGGSSGAGITLSAANGIGTELAPVLVNASTGHTVNATVTGTGSLDLRSTGTLTGGLTTSVHNGATRVTAAGNTLLTSMTSTTDAVGNDIRVTASAGNLTVGTVSGGAHASHNAVDLRASAGTIVTSGSTTIQAHDVTLYGSSGLGTSGQRISASGQRVNVSSGGGAIYLGASADTVLTNVSSNAGLIDISTTADLQLANAVSSGGDIVVTSTTAGVDLIAGNINAGAGNVTMTSIGASGTVQDDGNTSTRVSGTTVTLDGIGGLGSSTRAVGTSATTLTVSGAGAYVDDANTNGVTLSTAGTATGPVVINTSGPTTVTLLDSTGNVILTTISGDLTVASITAHSGAVDLTAAGSILGSGSGPHVAAQSVGMTAGANIGVVTDAVTGAGTPFRVATTSFNGLSRLTSSGNNAVISVRNDNTGLFAVPGNLLSMGSGGSAYLSVATDITFSAGPFAFTGNLLLNSDGMLVLPSAGISATGRLGLIGTTDIISAGGSPRVVTAGGNSIYLRSGATGGATTFNTTASSLDMAMSRVGAMTVDNTGSLTSTTLATSAGNISATSSTGMTAGSVIAGGAGRTVGLTATNGNLAVGTVNAGSGGTINLSAANGSLHTGSSSFIGSNLNLTSGSAIGTSGAAFDATGMLVSAQITGTGGLYLRSSGTLTTGALSTADGDIAVTSTGDLNASGTISAGTSGNTFLTSIGGNVTLAQAHTNAGADISRSGLAVQGNTITLNGGSVSTSGAQSYTGAVVLGGNTTLTGKSVAFSVTLDGAHDLTVNAGSGTASFIGAVGGTTRLGALAINTSGDTILSGSVRAGSVATDAAGTLALNGGTIETIGTQSYGERAVLGANTTLTGSTVTLSNGADATTAGGQSLTIAGNAVTGGAVGASQSLASLGVSGTSSLGGNVNTTDAQTYSGASILTANTTLNGVGVSFGSTLDGAHDLTLNAGSGAASFGGAVGGTTRLGALAIHSDGATTLGSSVLAGSVATDAAGTLALNGGTVETTGTQSYGERAVLGANTTLTGSTVTLSNGADATTAGGQGLAITGNSVTGGALGANQALASLGVSGTSALGGNVTTAGTQTYNGATTLNADTTLAGVGITLGTVDGAHDLTVNAGSGAANFGGAVGGTTRLGALAIHSNGATTLASTVRAASVSTDAAGTLALNGGWVDTSATQSYGERAVFGANTTLTGSNITLSQGADATTAGGQSLTLTGDAVLGGALGSNQALSSLAVSGNTALGANVATTGTQTYTGAVAVNGDATLHSSGGDLVFGSTLDSASARAITLRADIGAIDVTGDVGATSALGALTLRAGTLTTFNGSVRTAQVAQTAGGGLTRFLGAVRAQGAGGIGFTGHSVQFGDALKADAGGITLALSDANGTVVFGQNSVVQAASGFTQTGGASVQLPATLNVISGPISMQAPAYRSSGNISLSTEGDITLAGLVAPSSVVRMSAGTGILAVGQANGAVDEVMAVGHLEVPTAGSAVIYGRIGGRGGAFAASRIDSALVGSPYFMNDTPWGPIDLIATVTATTVPVSVVPSTPGASPLFTGVVDRGGIAPNVLGAYASPQVLRVAPMAPLIAPAPLPSPSSNPTPAPPASSSSSSPSPAVPASDPPILQPMAPQATPEAPAGPIAVPTPGEERDDLDDSKPR